MSQLLIMLSSSCWHVTQCICLAVPCTHVSSLSQGSANKISIVKNSVRKIIWWMVFGGEVSSVYVRLYMRLCSLFLGKRYWYIYSCGYHGELEYAKIYHDPGGLARQGRWYIVNVGQPTRSKVNILRLGGRGLWGGSSLKIFTELRVGRPTFLHMCRIHDSRVSIWYWYLRWKTKSHPCKSVIF